MSERLEVREFTRPLSARITTGVLIAIVHLVPLIVIFLGTTSTDWILFAIIYPIQLMGIGLCMHRYFAHNCFKTSRPFQFMLALMGAAAFGNPVGFAGKHRLHHVHADHKDDPHTPLHGFWTSWFGSHLDSRYSEEEVLAQVKGLTEYPELMWLHRNPRFVGLTLCLLTLLLFGFSGMAIGVLLGAAIVLNLSSAVNYFCHKYGSRRYDTNDQSTNSFVVALLAGGEGWHNNHHRYPVSARAGFFWWEIDYFYWVICLWESLGLVWDVQRPPERLLQAGVLQTSQS